MVSACTLYKGYDIIIIIRYFVYYTFRCRLKIKRETKKCTSYDIEVANLNQSQPCVKKVTKQSGNLLF